MKTVRCEKCAAEFHYELSRSCSGAGTAPYYLFQGAAKKRAEKQARKRLTRRLNHDAEMVPCPACQWVNREAIRQFRKTQQQGWTTLGAAVLLLGAIITAVCYLNGETIFGLEVGFFSSEIARIYLVTLLVACLIFMVQWLLRRRIDPNRSDGKQRIPAGTPPALTRDPTSGLLLATPSDLSNLQSEAEWATFRTGQLALAPLCCECLVPAETSYAAPMPAQPEKLAVPLCRGCRRRLRGRWWLGVLAAIPVAFCIAWLLAQLAPIDDIGRSMLTFMGTGVLTLLGIVLVDHFVRPYRIRCVDASRGVWKLHFHNPAYTALLIRELGQSDGLFGSTDAGLEGRKEGQFTR